MGHWILSDVADVVEEESVVVELVVGEKRGSEIRDRYM